MAHSIDNQPLQMMTTISDLQFTHSNLELTLVHHVLAVEGNITGKSHDKLKLVIYDDSNAIRS